MSDKNKTTVRTRAVTPADEVRAAQNRFAVAIKNYRLQPTDANQKELEAAQDALYQVQDLYHEGRKLKLVHVLSKKNGRPS